MLKSTIRPNSNGENISEIAQWLNSNTNQMPNTLLKTVAKTDHTSRHTNLTKSDHAADIDPSEGNQELYYPDGKSMFSTVALPIGKKHPLSQRPALMSASENTSKESLCRLCAKLVCMSQMVHIFRKSSSSKEYLRKMNQLLPSSAQPTETDLLPKWICNVCCERLNYCDQAVHDFVLASVKLKCLLAPTKQDQAVINNFELAARQAGNMVKQENFEEELFHFLLNSDTNQEQDRPVENCAYSQQIEDVSKVVPRPTSRQDMDITQSYPAMSVLMDHNYDSLKYTGLQCENSVSDENCLFHNTSTTNHGIKVRKQLTNDSPLPFESQDSSFSGSVLVGDIISPMKRKALLDNEIKSTSVSFSSKLIKVESVDPVDSFKFSKGMVSNKQNLLSFGSSSQSKKRKRVREQEKFQGKLIKSSHTLIPTASDNKTFLCKKCDLSFVSIESALTHRFKEHPEEEILYT